MAKINKPTPELAQLVSDRRAQMGLTKAAQPVVVKKKEQAAIPIELKAEKLTATQYLKRAFINKPIGTEELIIRACWKGNDGKGRYRVNLYDPMEFQLTGSFFVLLWHTKDEWKHEIVSEDIYR